MNIYVSLPQHTGCQYQTLFQFQLKNHRVMHEESRPWICEVCGKAFKQKGVLDIHIKTVHGIGGQLFMCNECGKQLKTAVALKVREHFIQGPPVQVFFFLLNNFLIFAHIYIHLIHTSVHERLTHMSQTIYSHTTT